MVGLRDLHYGDKFLVMVGAHIDVDYLLSFFDKNIFTENEISKLIMPNDFIESDTKGLISKTKQVEFNRSSLGSLELLCVTTASQFRNMSLKLNAGEIPRYFVDVTQRKVKVKESNYGPNSLLSEYCDKQDSGLYRFNDNWYSLFTTPKEKTLDIEIGAPNALRVIKKTTNSITVLAERDTLVNGYNLQKGNQYNINFGTFGSIAGEEYFINKGLLKYLPNMESNLIESLSQIIRKN